MRTFHPAFDGRVWFVEVKDDKPVEGKSIRLLIDALRTRFNCRVCIKDYFPEGYRAKPAWPSDKIGVPQRSRPLPEKRRVQIFAKPYEPHYDHEQIMNLWAKGWTAPRIAEHLAMPRWQTVGQIVCEKRKQGDPRAIVRTTNPRWREPK